MKFYHQSLKRFVYCNVYKRWKFTSIYSNNSPTTLDIQRHMHLRPYIIFSWHDLIRFGTLNIFSLKKVRNFFGFSYFSFDSSHYTCLHKCIYYWKDANPNFSQKANQAWKKWLSTSASYKLFKDNFRLPLHLLIFIIS